MSLPLEMSVCVELSVSLSAAGDVCLFVELSVSLSAARDVYVELCGCCSITCAVYNMSPPCYLITKERERERERERGGGLTRTRVSAAPAVSITAPMLKESARG